MDGIHGVKDLDALNVMMRKGKLVINPRNLMVIATIDVVCPKKKDTYMENYSLGLCPKLDDKNEYSWVKEKIKFKQRIHAEFSKLNLHADTSSLRIFIRRKGRTDTYRNESIPLVDFGGKWVDMKNAAGEEDHKCVYNLQTHYGIKLDKILTADEITTLAWKGENHDKTVISNTPKEWCLFLRTIRKRVRRLMLDGKLRGVLNRCDRIKEHKDHGEVIKDVIQRTESVKQAVMTLKGLSDEMARRLTPFIKVHPYDSIRSHLHLIEDHIDSILAFVHDIEVTSGVRKPDPDED